MKNIEGYTVEVVKGCKARDLRKGQKARVYKVEAGDGCVRVVLEIFQPYRATAWYVRHANRLEDSEIGMNDGNPLHKIKVRVL